MDFMNVDGVGYKHGSFNRFRHINQGEIPMLTCIRYHGYGMICINIYTLTKISFLNGFHDQQLDLSIV